MKFIVEITDKRDKCEVEGDGIELLAHLVRYLSVNDALRLLLKEAVRLTELTLEDPACRDLVNEFKEEHSKNRK